MTWLHILAGLLALASGAVALYVRKGATLHRKSGTVFVYAMLVMSSSGAALAALRPDRVSVIAGALTFYLVLSGLRTLRRRADSKNRIDIGAMLLGFTVGIAGIWIGIAAQANSSGIVDGKQPAAVAIVFGAIALLAAFLDLRMMLAGEISGVHRIARHLWRMCFALFIATASLFLGQAQVFPEPLRNIGVLATPVLLVLLLMFFWLARVLFTPRLKRGISRRPKALGG